MTSSASAAGEQQPAKTLLSRMTEFTAPGEGKHKATDNANDKGADKASSTQKDLEKGTTPKKDADKKGSPEHGATVLYHVSDGMGGYAQVGPVPYRPDGPEGIRREEGWRPCSRFIWWSCFLLVFAMLAYIATRLVLEPSASHRGESYTVRAAAKPPAVDLPATAAENAATFDCDADYAHWEKGWSYQKKQYCCGTKGRGCTVASGPLYQCHTGTADMWTLSKQQYCCHNYQVGCIQFDCTAGLDNWVKGWSNPKKHFCCQRFTVGCPFDCSADLANAQVAWSEHQKDWCCANANKCFPDVAAEASSNTTHHHASGNTHQDHRGVGHQAAHQSSNNATSHHAVSTAPDHQGSDDDAASNPYAWHDCNAGELDSWTAAKRKFCCRHLDIGCLAVDSNTTHQERAHANLDNNASVTEI